jgi:tetratricopeptide (TPR) repeat protein
VDTFTEALALADAHLRGGRLAQAADSYGELHWLHPLDVDILGSLGMVLAALGRTGEAVHRYAQLLRLQPDRAEARRNLASTLRQFGQDLVSRGLLPAMALDAPGGAFDPDLPESCLQLGHFFQFHGIGREAVIQYERAVARDPRCTEALLRLGTLQAEAGALAAAAKWFRWALAVDPGLAEANFNLAAILESEARLAEAQIYRGRLPRPMPLEVQTAPEPHPRVLVACAAGSGNLPTELLLPPATTTRIRWFPEGSTDEQEAALPPFDVVFNAIGNADVAGFSCERLGRFQERLAGKAMLNPPERVLATRRDRMPELLAGIPGVVVPRVLRLGREEVLDPCLVDRLEAMGLPLPLLVRPIGTQGGKGASRVETPDQLARATALDADAYYAIAFHDTRSSDGQYRKYRMIFVDRLAYPYHLAISPHWLVHWYSAGMGEAPWKREEERRFLEDPQGVLGPAGLEAIGAIARRLDLDYAGIDFTLLPDGRILVFEANATMLVHLDDPRGDYPYKHAAVPVILEAFQAMLLKASGPADRPKGS